MEMGFDELYVLVFPTQNFSNPIVTNIQIQVIMSHYWITGE